jgi:two-component system, cell cycle sensor histidine kinase and response regulator CckA
VQASDIRAHPLVAVFCFLGLFSAVFFAFQHSLAGDGAFIICNLLPPVFAALFGLRWGIGYAIIHAGYGFALGGIAGMDFDRFISNGIPAMIVTIILSGAVGRVRDLTTSLQRELKERHRYEQELQQHKAQLESLVEERTSDLVRSNERLRQEIAEREKAEAEKQHLEASLKRAEKMEAIGVLAGSVAHDLNNILGSLIGYPDLLLLDLPEHSPLREALVAIRESGLRASAVVQDLLTMARRGVTTTQVLDLNEVVSDLLKAPEFLNLRARHRDIRIATNLNPAALNIHGSAAHLSRAILNLALNAMEAIEHGGQVTISTTNVYIDAPSSRYEVLAEGEYVALTVQDTGGGIPREDLDRIFEPFYTKKVMGRSGTGLGLAIVWGTVKDHGGFVDVRSEQGQGTTFTLFLPATREALPAAPADVSLDRYLGNGESILVVDDVTMQRELCAAMLTKLGYSVACAASGEEAVDHVRRSRVDLVILDMIMEPGIDGLETYKRIIEKSPGQRSVIASGFSESQRVKEAQALGAGTYMRKPYTLEKLALIVRDELRRHG